MISEFRWVKIKRKSGSILLDNQHFQNDTEDIKSKDDIPEEVIKYFDESYNFLKELVGEENIVMAQVHFDEDTPHLQAYFLPVANEVKRKCYQRDKDGNLIKEIKKDRNGKVKVDIISE